MRRQNLMSLGDEGTFGAVAEFPPATPGVTPYWDQDAVISATGTFRGPRGSNARSGVTGRGGHVLTDWSLAPTVVGSRERGGG